MNLIDLKNSISKKDVEPLYVFYGEEYKILEIYIKKICDCLGLEPISSDSVETVYNGLSNKSLFGSNKSVYVIRDDKSFLTKESLWEDIYKKLKNKNITIILKYSTIDCKTKFYKKFQDFCVSFNYLSSDVLCKYIKKDVSIDQKSSEYLIDICCNNYGRILLELDKIINLSEFLHISNQDSFNMCCKEKAFFKNSELQIFDFVDSILSRNSKLSFYYLKELHESGESPLGVLSLLHNNVKACIQVMCCGQQQDIMKVTGLSSFQIKNANKYINNYSINEFIQFIKYIRYCEKSFKQGLLSEYNVLDYLLCQIL